MNDAERFLRHVLAPVRKDERWRLEYVDGETREQQGRSRAWLDIEKMAAQALRYGDAQNVYYALATFGADGQHGKPGRRQAANARRLGALWADLDVGPGKPYQARQDALDRLARFGPAPTAIINSGRGIHAYWKLAEPAEGDDLARAVRLVRGLADDLNGDRGVADAARIMRIPGTQNLDPKSLKDGQAYSVELLSLDDLAPGYTFDDFDDFDIEEIGTVQEERTDAGEAPAPAEFEGGTVHPHPRLGGLIRGLLTTTGASGYPSASNADEALLLALVSPTGAGLTPGDTYATFMASPRGQDAISRKPDPHYYVTHSIENALAYLEANTPEDEIRQQILSKDEITTDDRAMLLADISERLAFRVTGFQRIVADEPQFRMFTDRGQVLFGPWANIYSPAKFEQFVEPVVGTTPPSFKKPQWKALRLLLLKAAVDVMPSDELTESGRTRAWLDEYLTHFTPDWNASDDARLEAAIAGAPFVLDGQIHISLVAFLQFLRTRLEERPNRTEVILGLHAVGWEAQYQRVYDGRREHKRFRTWRSPAHWKE